MNWQEEDCELKHRAPMHDLAARSAWDARGIKEYQQVGRAKLTTDYLEISE